ncbi:hypothetical protein BJ994_000881 [Arthrobacter pigmenti]|uniref:Uncharacterized protein n=1 Tax=Arthrobacter pigmenti TaxID=271432 RepID=A0A846RPY7_9MICC|nr:serine/threonine protein phosphatase [Arthrobacter pigmenti]NJC21805.1 hypothetical protein [Arthrobacter pigmenti]
MVTPLPAQNTFDHLRSSDGEHVGYINLTQDGRFVPFDLLHRQRAEPMDLDEAENLLDELGLRMFTEDWWLIRDGQQEKVLICEIRRDSISVARAMPGTIAKSVDLTETIDLPLPTDRLVQTGQSA